MFSYISNLYVFAHMRIKYHSILLGCIFTLLSFLLNPPLQAQTQPHLMVYGDSLVAGYGLAQEQSFPSQLQAKLDALGVDIKISNAGVSGDTTAGGRSRLGWTLAEEPGGIILVLGGNDMLRGLDPAAAFDNLNAILSELARQNIPVLLCGMLASANLGADYQQQFDRIYTELAAQHDVLFYPFFLEGVALVPELNQPDGIHPNAEGVSMIISQMQPAIESLLTQMGVDW